MKSRLIIALVVLLLVAIFALQNAEAVPVRFLFWTATLSRAMLLLLVFVAGLGSGWLLHSYLHMRKRISR